MALTRRKSTKRRTGDESRQKILSAACAVFSERGFEKASVREVARRAGISVGGIYLYFPNKQELYTGLMRSQVDEFISSMEHLRSETPDAALRGFIQSYMDIAVKKTKMLSTGIKEYDLEFRKPVREAFFHAQHRLITHILREGVRQGVFRDIDCAETGRIIIISLRGAILGYLTGDIRRPDTYARDFHTFLLRSIRSIRDA